MSTKTTFKRIALVAVAALGMGLVSSIPAQAAPSAVTITLGSAGAKTLGSTTVDTTTGQTVTITALNSVATDSVYVSITPKSFPSGATTSTILGNLLFLDTAVTTASLATTDTVFAVWTTGGTANVPVTVSQTAARGAALSASGLAGGGVSIGGRGAESITTTSTGATSITSFNLTNGSGTTGYVGGRFRLYLDDSYGSRVTAGTYTFTITATPYTGATAGTPVTADATIVVSSPSVSGSTSTAYIGPGTGNTYNSDTMVVAATVVSGSPVAYVTVALKDADAAVTGVRESVTVTSTVGNVGDATGTVLGKNVILQYTAGSSLNVGIFGDGTSGVSSICISTPSVTFACKSITFYSTTAASLTATQVSSVLKVGSNSNAIVANAKDASGNWIPLTTATYIFSDNTAVVSETASSCSVDTTNSRMNCTLTGVAAGTANISIGTNTAKANVAGPFKVTVTSNAIASISLTSNKTSYAPGEKAYIRVVAKDSAGNSVAPQTIANFFATGGITTDVGLGANSETISVTSVTLGAATTTGYASGEAVYNYTVYMPSGSTSVTFSATGGAGLPVAAQKAVSLKVDVTDSGAAAIAAVTALASQVSAFITKINAQITTLTDLVMKIQKKVKA